MSSDWLGAVPRAGYGRLAVLLVAAPAAFVPAGGCGDVTSQAGGSDASVQTDVLNASPGDEVVVPPLDSSSCQPGDVQTYVPQPYRPATSAAQSVCSFVAMQQFYASCLGATATKSDCADFAQNQPSCEACLLTPSTADHYGPLIDFGGFILPNVAGCLELGGSLPGSDSGLDHGAMQCAKSVQALVGCELLACEANCPVHTSLDAYNSCASAADTNGCELYAKSVTSCTGAYKDAGLSDAGFSPSSCFASFKDYFGTVAPLFCGSPSAPPVEADAGQADAGADASETDAADATVPDAAE